jgi:hypothetical protein
MPEYETLLVRNAFLFFVAIARCLGKLRDLGVQGDIAYH